MSFFSELQRRNVWRVALLYLVASWLVLQVTDILVPALALPEFSLRFVTLILILGFPLALLFSWVYELTPEGLKRERDIDRSESITHATGHKLNLAIVALLVLAIGGLAIDRVIPESGHATSSKSVSNNSTTVARDEIQEIVSQSPPELSIAVLPFEIRGAEGDVEIFALAIADQLRMMLTSDRRLKVTGSISSDIAAKQQLGVSEIRRQLGVAHVLRGTAIAVGGKLQVQAELVGTRDGFNVWSQGYERQADDLSGVPESIASEVLDVIAKESTGSGRPADRGAESLKPEAYRAYLMGAYFLDRDGSAADHERAATELQRVVELEPKYAMGWARLARAQLGAAVRKPAEQSALFQASRIAAERAIALSPDLAEAWAVLAGIKISTISDIPGAYVAAQRAKRLNNSMEYPLRLAGVLESAYGRPFEAMKLSVEAASIDPLSTKTLRNACLYALYADQFDLAIEYGMRSLDINENTVVVPYMLARAYAAKGEIAQASAILEQEPIKPFQDFGRAYVYIADEDSVKTDAQIEFLIEKYADIAALNIAELKGLLGETDEAFEWLDAALESKDSGLFEARSMPGLRILHEDPRWQAFVDKAGLQDPS